mgnify:CR=1 FL=1
MAGYRIMIYCIIVQKRQMILQYYSAAGYLIVKWMSYLLLASQSEMINAFFLIKSGILTTARMILVKSETDFDKFDMAFEECFKAAQRETEVGKEMLRWLDKSDMMELAHSL